MDEPVQNFSTELTSCKVYGHRENVHLRSIHENGGWRKELCFLIRKFEIEFYRCQKWLNRKWLHLKLIHKLKPELGVDKFLLDISSLFQDCVISDCIDHLLVQSQCHFWHLSTRYSFRILIILQDNLSLSLSLWMESDVNEMTKRRDQYPESGAGSCQGSVHYQSERSRPYPHSWIWICTTKIGPVSSTRWSLQHKSSPKCGIEFVPSQKVLRSITLTLRVLISEHCDLVHPTR